MSVLDNVPATKPPEQSHYPGSEPIGVTGAGSLGEADAAALVDGQTVLVDGQTVFEVIPEPGTTVPGANGEPMIVVEQEFSPWLPLLFALGFAFALSRR